MASGVQYHVANPTTLDGSAKAVGTAAGSSPSTYCCVNVGTTTSPNWLQYVPGITGTVVASDFQVVYTCTSTTAPNTAVLGYGASDPTLRSVTSGSLTLTSGTDAPVTYLDTLLKTVGASGAETWARVGTLPAGLSFAPAKGIISGTPTAKVAGLALTYAVTDARGVPSAPATPALTVK